MTEPGNETATAQGRDGLRASHSDREQVAAALRAAFVQGRLTQDELEARAEQVYASRTHAELAEIIADIPTVLTGTRPPRAPWRATKKAWWFEYAVFLPGIVAIIALPGGPHTTVWTLMIYAAVIYPVFWVLGVVKVAAARREQPRGGQQLFDRKVVTDGLRKALKQGLLTEDEHDMRAAQVPAARSRAELAALTADLPAGLTTRLPRASDVWTGAGMSIGAAGVLAALLLLQPDDFLAFATALAAAATVLLAPPITVGLMIDARHQSRLGRQLRLGPALSANG
jgi:Domain of unknown function (DUF1707)